MKSVVCGVQNHESKRKTVISLFLYLCSLRHFGYSENIFDRFFLLVPPPPPPCSSFSFEVSKFLGLFFLLFNDKFYNPCTVVSWFLVVVFFFVPL